MSISALIIDHYDSFTYNIKAWLKKDNFSVTIISYDDLNLSEQLTKNWDLIILSPGPGKPRDYQQTLELLKDKQDQTPIFGICLGMQMMIHNGDDDIMPYTPPLHGKKSIIKTSSSSIFKDLPEIEVGRYHSLATQNVTDEFNVIATSRENLIMGVEHKTKKLLGVQFHPESFLTSQANVIRDNLIRWINE